MDTQLPSSLLTGSAFQTATANWSVNTESATAGRAYGGLVLGSGTSLYTSTILQPGQVMNNDLALSRLDSILFSLQSALRDAIVGAGNSHYEIENLRGEIRLLSTALAETNRKYDELLFQIETGKLAELQEKETVLQEDPLSDLPF